MESVVLVSHSETSVVNTTMETGVNRPVITGNNFSRPFFRAPAALPEPVSLVKSRHSKHLQTPRLYVVCKAVILFVRYITN